MRGRRAWSWRPGKMSGLAAGRPAGWAHLAGWFGSVAPAGLAGLAGLVALVPVATVVVAWAAMLCRLPAWSEQTA